MVGKYQISILGNFYGSNRIGWKGLTIKEWNVNQKKQNQK